MTREDHRALIKRTIIEAGCAPQFNVLATEVGEEEALNRYEALLANMDEHYANEKEDQARREQEVLEKKRMEAFEKRCIGMTETERVDALLDEFFDMAVEEFGEAEGSGIFESQMQTYAERIEKNPDIPCCIDPSIN